MPRRIPGYYYDEDSKKYFKLPRNGIEPSKKKEDVPPAVSGNRQRPPSTHRSLSERMKRWLSVASVQTYDCSLVFIG